MVENKNVRIMIEFFHANTHKGVHIGHIRNISLGESISRLLEFDGNWVRRVNYQGDIGPHVAKCIWGYKHFGIGKEPDKHKGKWLGKIYAQANEKVKQDESLEQEIRTLTKKLYEGKDKDLLKLWWKTRQWCLDDFDDFYKEFNVKFNRLFFESEVEQAGRKLVDDMLKKKTAEKSEGAVIIDLNKYNLGVFLLLRSDGVGLYSTKDLGLAKLKFDTFKIDKSLHIVGKEQELYFKQLFRTFDMMKTDWGKKSQHIIYELVMLPEGKMSSREGTIVLYEDLKCELYKLAKKEVEIRHEEWSRKDIEKASKQIMFAALKFSMLNRDNTRIITFDWDKALDFEGESGPYVQYAHARICSILRKHGEKVLDDVDFTILNEEHELKLIKMLGKFPEVVSEAANHCKPSLITRYLLDLSQLFNEFYHQIPILKVDDDDVKESRLLLAYCTKSVLKNGLKLLGIDAPQQM